jgi:hypothetical protein
MILFLFLGSLVLNIMLHQPSSYTLASAGSTMATEEQVFT